MRNQFLSYTHNRVACSLLDFIEVCMPLYGLTRHLAKL
jgi:hypothetical protein